MSFLIFYYMPSVKLLLFFSVYFVSIFLSQSDLLAQDTIPAAGLEKDVEIVIDRWGVSHIYADTERDLFFAQGFNVARDRLFQLEIWRRQATGTVAEWLGPSEIDRDIGARLFKFRGDMEKEVQHYHPRGAQIIESFVRGINAYIDWVKDNPEHLPPEFAELGLEVKHWTNEVVISRHQGLLGNITSELNIGRTVAELGEERVKELYWFHPYEPLLELHPPVDGEALSEDILHLYNAFRQTLRFNPDRHPIVRPELSTTPENENNSRDALEDSEGSNNWVIAGERTQSGYPMLANDPHRALATPSLRYMTHLIGPGWNVAGAGEPAIPGLSIGHNENGGWGLTVYRTDAEDLYVYQTHPDDSKKYRYKGAWETMESIQEMIPVNGQEPIEAELWYTRHGPVVFHDEVRNLAYAVRCGWLEIGGAPYLASLRMDQATTFEEFRKACNYSHIPGENMIWADKEGNIGWQAVGIAPKRPNWSGLVPVPGDGRFEWNGYLEILKLPHSSNPESGLIITANENVTPRNYPHLDALGFVWTDPFRGDRIAELLGGSRRISLPDMMAAQTDYLSLPARTLVPLLNGLSVENYMAENARRLLLNWDYRLRKESVAAAIYVTWENQLKQRLLEMEQIPVGNFNLGVQLKTVIDWILAPDGRFGDQPLRGRDTLLIEALSDAVNQLEARLGSDMEKWQFGQESYKHVIIRHAFEKGLSTELANTLRVGPLPRGGNGYTVNNTRADKDENQVGGATFRILMDLENWDLTLATNAPGQSGDPRDRHYNDLFPLWASDQYFPLFYSRAKINSVAERTIHLQAD
jgi:penicillin amidase